MDAFAVCRCHPVQYMYLHVSLHRSYRYFVDPAIG